MYIDSIFKKLKVKINENVTTTEETKASRVNHLLSQHDYRPKYAATLREKARGEWDK